MYVFMYIYNIYIYMYVCIYIYIYITKASSPRMCSKEHRGFLGGVAGGPRIHIECPRASIDRPRAATESLQTLVESPRGAPWGSEKTR